MSVIAHAAASVASTPVPTPSHSPVATPVITPITHAVTAVAHTGLLDSLNSLAASIPQSDVIAAGAVLAVAVQGLLNRLPGLSHEVAWIQDIRRQVVAIVIPAAGVAVASFASGHNDLNLAPVVYLAGQVVFYAIKAIRGSAALVAPQPATGDAESGVA